MPNKEPVKVEKKIDKKFISQKVKKEALSLTEKNRRKIRLWFLLIYLFLATVLAFSTFIAVYKHQKAMTSLNKANEIMMTNTGIVIDSVNIKSFQEAEYILSEKQKTIEIPDTVRNIFMFDTRTHINSSGVTSVVQEDSAEELMEDDLEALTTSTELKSN